MFSFFMLPEANNIQEKRISPDEVEHSTSRDFQQKSTMEDSTFPSMAFTIGFSDDESLFSMSDYGDCSIMDIEDDLEEEECYDDCTTMDIEDTTEEEESTTRVYGPAFWAAVAMQEVEKIPNAIDGKASYKIAATTRLELLEKCTDGRRWKKDSSTTWKGYEKKVRYRDCRGSLICPRLECEYRKEYGKENRLKFDKNQVIDFKIKICISNYIEKI